ncbi:hypothetical protein B0H14DRAFT_3526963 [Mycena olivaceomarginata]|nr:hypothetical protein B0H14DRAFT_3526963 [Mycena olivaceomarginata]
MKWTRFLDVARQGQCRIENYPPALEQAGLIIGTPSFNIKKITSEMFAKFLPDMEKASKRPPGEREEGDDEPVEAMAIVPWTDDECMLSLEEQAAIGIVLSVDGRVLAAVNHSDRYQKEVQTRREKRKRKRGKGRGGGPSSSEDTTTTTVGGGLSRRGQGETTTTYAVIRSVSTCRALRTTTTALSRDRSRSPGRGGRDGPPSAAAPPPPPAPPALVEYETSDRRRSRSRSSHRVKYGTTSRRRSPLPLPSPCRVRDHSVPPLPIPCARWAVDQRPSWLMPLPLPSSPRLVVTPHRPEVLPSRLYARLALSCEGNRSRAAIFAHATGPPKTARWPRIRGCGGEDLATARPQPLDEGERGRALADRVSGAAKRKAHPEGEGEDSERNPKRARKREIQEPRAEEGPAPLRMRFFVQDEMSRIFYARGLERVVKSSRADRHTLVDKQGEWVALRPHMTRSWRRQLTLKST